jgi:hypothetical protein
MRVCVLAIALLLCQEFAAAQSTVASPPAAAPLPVRRVVLYKTGVGYFEHHGRVRDSERITVRFTSRQLNDVLKSLTTIDPEGRIGGISYNSVAPLEQRLGALRLPLGPTGTAFDLMGSLRGALVEVSGKSMPIRGRLLGVERKVQVIREREYEVQEFSIVTDAGTVRSFELTPAVSVRVLDRGLRQEIGRYLDVIGSTREQDVRDVVITTIGTGVRPVLVTYVSEVPIWKSTYRLVIPASGEPFIQGWAVVDNTVGEDWNGVELSLVAGAPQSYIQQLSQPFYRERPVLPIPSAVLTTPQTHQPGLGGNLRVEPDRTRRVRPDSAGVSSVVEAGMPGGVIGGVVGGIAAEAPPPMSLRDVEPAAQASDLGDLFEYRIKEPVTLQKNQSALVPIINTPIGIEKVSLWARGAVSGHPLRALWLTNTTGMTLDGGSVTVIDGSAFAGEGLIDSLAPTAKRLVSYGEDLGIIVTGSLKNGPARVSRMRASDGVLALQSEEQATWSYAIRNENLAPSTLVLEHSIRPGWTLGDGHAIDEMAPGAPRFRIAIAAGEEKTFVVREVRRQEERIEISEIDETELWQLTRGGLPSDTVRAALQPVLAKKVELAQFERTLASLSGDEARIAGDQQRLRENMKALRGSAEEKPLLQRYTRQLDEQETRLDVLRQAIARAKAQVEAARAELAGLIRSLRFEL